MSVFDGRRLPVSTFKLDVDRMRRGWYSDKYFPNVVRMLAEMAERGTRFGGVAADLSDINRDLAEVDVGNLEVEMQWFTRRLPYSIVAGVDKTLAMLQTCTGYFDADDRWHDTYDQLRVEAVHDGAVAHYAGDPRDVQPVMRCARPVSRLRGAGNPHARSADAGHARRHERVPRAGGGGR